jgi:hypothetical protein
MAIDERASWEAFQASPWKPPASLETALSKVRGPRVWLSHAVDIMAFGDEGVPVEPEQRSRRRGFIMEVAARRCQASRALCQATQNGALSIRGSRNGDSDASERIPSEYFDTPRRLGSEDNSLETDPDKIPTDKSTRARREHQKWFNVRIDCGSLIAWLRGPSSTNSENLAGKIDRHESSSAAQEPLIKPREGSSPVGRSLKAALDQAFPEGVPDAPLSHIYEKIAATAAFRTRGLSKTKLQNQSYDTTIKRLLGRAKS